jgi:hypothetical protein
LSTQVRHCLPSGLFPSGFPTNILYTFLVSPIRSTTPPISIYSSKEIYILEVDITYFCMHLSLPQFLLHRVLASS